MSDPDTWNVQELIDYIESFGYAANALSNEDIHALATELWDGNQEEETDELQF